MAGIISVDFLATVAVFYGLYILCTVAVRVFRYRRRVQQLMKLPGIKGHWLMGGLAEVSGPGSAGIKFMRDSLTQFPKVAYNFFGPILAVVTVTHPETAKQILKTAEPKPLSGAYAMTLPWLGYGLLTSGGKRWGRNRRLLTPAFHFGILKPYMDVNNKAADVLIDKLAALQGEYFEVLEHISLCTLEIILTCAFSYGVDIQTLGNEHPYVTAVKELTQTLVYRLFRPWLYPDILFYISPTGRRFKQNCDYVHTVADDVIKSRKKTNKEVGPKKRKHMDFLDILLNARDEEGRGMSVSEIRDEVDTFMFEGHDTTASAISWLLYSLAEYPEWQTRCQTEVDAILEDRDSDNIKWEDLEALNTLTMCMKESLRLHPTVPIIQRETTKDMYIDSFYIPAGTIIDIQLHLVLHNPLVWEDPMKYDPERFTGKDAELRSSYAFIPFSAGPRNCLGQNFAMHEIKTVVSRILRKFDLHVDQERPVKEEIAVVMKTEDGMFLKATPRK